MSIQCIAWVFKQPVKPSSLKFVLVAMADCANEKDDMRCWPSVDHLCETTSQDRKTVLANIATLVKMGWLVETQERKGRTKQVKVYKLCLPEINNTKSGTVRVIPDVIHKESRFSHERVPKTDGKESRKRDTEPLLESLNESAKAGAEKKCERNPESHQAETLPYDWQSYAENLGINVDHIFRSWKRFKSTSAYPWRRDRWHAWVDGEKTGKRSGGRL